MYKFETDSSIVKGTEGILKGIFVRNFLIDIFYLRNIFVLIEFLKLILESLIYKLSINLL